MQTIPATPNSAAEMDERMWWDLWNSSYRVGDDNGEIPNEHFARVAATVNEFTQSNKSRVLEIGCGTGTLSRKLKFTNYHGIDLSAAAIELATQSLNRSPESGSSAKYEAVDLHDWPLPQEPFDVAVCVDAFVWVRDQQLAVRKIAQSLRTGGRLVISIINPFVYRRIRRTATNPLKEGPVRNWLSRRDLHTLINSAGFTIERSFTIMPRGNMGVLRLMNSPRLNEVLGRQVAKILRRAKEQIGIGQYRVLVARKD